jgi:hypothetical protein
MENDYEMGEPDGYVCKECGSTYTIKTFNRMTKNGEQDPECGYCLDSNILPMQVKEQPKVEDLKPFQKFRIIYTALEQVDDYYEDDYGNECHSLTGSVEVRFMDIYEKVNAVKETGRAIENIYEMNASNPPYDSYKVVLVYDMCTKEVFPIRYFESATEYYDDEVK